MELEWTDELTDACAALATIASDMQAVEQAARRVKVSIASVSFPANAQGQWQSLFEAALGQEKLFALLRDLNRMYRESTALRDALARCAPSMERIGRACTALRRHVETLRTPDDVDEADLSDLSVELQGLFELDDEWQDFLRRPLDHDGRDVRSERRTRRRFRSRLEACLLALQTYSDVVRRGETLEPFGAGGLQAIAEAGARTRLKLLVAVEDLVNLPKDIS
jgi:hypothetical protein